MKFFKSKEELHKAISIFLIIAASILFALGLYKFDVIIAGIKKLLGIFSPFITGLVIAYLLCPLLNFTEKKVFHKIKKSSARRALSTTTVYILFFGVAILLICFIVPNLISSISVLVSSIPDGINKLSAWFLDFTERYPEINEWYAQSADKLTDLLTDSVQYILSALQSLLPSVVNVTVAITNSVVNFFVGLVISIYMLISKETLIAQCKKLLFGFLPESKAQNLVNIGVVSHKKISSYLTGQISISLVDGCIVYLVSQILKFPYPLLLAVIVGFFNLIPFFGAIISCIPCLFIILIYDPIKALYFLIFFLILQQVEGNIIGPRIQGKQLNISGMWIIFAILLFGGLFGFWGLLIGVPLFSVGYMLFSQYLSFRLKAKGMSSDTNDYIK